MLSSHVRIAVSLVYIISSSVAVIFVPAILAQSAGQATVIVKVTGLRSEKGQVRNRCIQFVREMARRTTGILIDD
jgi:hypothetical protein